MHNRLFSVELRPENGGLKSLVLHDDPDCMNWIEGTGTWGVPLGMEFLSMERKENAAISRYRRNALELEVRRTMGDTFLRERFTFRNSAGCDLYFQRGALGIFGTFNDSYADAETCEKKRCHTHLWCGGANSYVHALKMGPFTTELALILTRGELDCYSVRRIECDSSNDRGDFVLHPSPAHLLPGADMTLEWELAAFPEGRFREALLARPGNCVIDFGQETVFAGESFRLTAECTEAPENVEVRCNGENVPFQLENRRIRVEFKPETLGEHRFDFTVTGRRFRAFGNCVEPIGELIDKRIRFIIRKQQMTDRASPLHGAYLIYDNEEHSQYFDCNNANHNACRERLGMGLLIARRLREKPDAEMARSLALFEQFVLREVFDPETGEVYNNIGKETRFKRLYNAPWMITFFVEMYRLRKKEKYLDWIERAMKNYYAGGGSRFYPNGSLFSDAVALLRDAGRNAAELAARVREHVAVIAANGILYPPHEVKFEQTIVTPALSILSAYYNMIDPDPALLEEAGAHARILVRFQGDQPDYRLREIPIRHWDGYWFGKRKLYGDTLHYWSCLSAHALRLYAGITGDEALLSRAKRCLRNTLALFFPDGSASCAYCHPFSVTMLHPDGTESDAARRGEFFDPWANDQDFALYYILRTGPELLFRPDRGSNQDTRKTTP